jgi:hypothetical protein
MNEREMNVINILFQSPVEMTSTDICNAQRGLTQSTVIAVLRKLLKSNLIETAGVTHSGKVLSRTYRPAPGAKKAVIECFIQELDKVKHVFSIDELAEAVKDGAQGA